MSFVQGKDTFVALPTGYGKSLKYAVLPLVFDAKRSIFIALNPPGSCTFILLYFYFAILFTGKSGSIFVCISPLTSLMMDQQAKYSLN